MNPLYFCRVLVLLMSVGGILRAAPHREETVALSDIRKVSIAPPTGFTFASGRDAEGLIRVRMNNADDSVSLQLTFLPDFEQRFMDGYERNRFLHESFSEFAESSVEKAMQFDDLKPKVGAGTFCVFTDAKLVGLPKYPPGEYLHATKGVKVWPGVMVVFSIFSNDTVSKDYQAAMNLMRESVVERSVPLR
jgi:hypothetical protein